MQYLVNVLLDNTASIADRDDAAMDLYEFTDDIAINALIKVAQNVKEDPIILNSCGESIACIWVKNDKFNKQIYNTLGEEAKIGVRYVLRHDRPDWLKEL